MKRYSLNRITLSAKEASGPFIQVPIECLQRALFYYLTTISTHAK